MCSLCLYVRVWMCTHEPFHGKDHLRIYTVTSDPIKASTLRSSIACLACVLLLLYVCILLHACLFDPIPVFTVYAVHTRLSLFDPIAGFTVYVVHVCPSLTLFPVFTVYVVHVCPSLTLFPVFTVYVVHVCPRLTLFPVFSVYTPTN